MGRYRQHVNRKFGKQFRTSHELHKWTVDWTGRHQFWTDLWDYVGMKPQLPANIKHAFDDTKGVHENPIWFEGVQINYAENVLEGRDPDTVALIGLREGEPLEGEKWTWAQLRENVRKARSALLALGVKKEEVVAVIMSNSNWTIAIFLAAASIGALFTSISPDMGLEGCTSRLVQSKPAVLFADSAQTYKAKRRSMKEKIRSVVGSLKGKPDVFIVPLSCAEDYEFPLLEDFLAKSRKEDALEYARVPFSYPMIMLYSSGTTGAPKCIVHQHGIILQLKKIAILHNSLTPKDVIFQYSSTSWVLWNVMVSLLSFQSQDSLLSLAPERTSQCWRHRDMLRRLTTASRCVHKIACPRSSQMHVLWYKPTLSARARNVRHPAISIRFVEPADGYDDRSDAHYRSIHLVLPGFSEECTLE
jgi:acetoacetyl-CoA synthetase